MLNSASKMKAIQLNSLPIYAPMNSDKLMHSLYDRALLVHLVLCDFSSFTSAAFAILLISKMIRKKIDSVETVSEVSQELNVKVVTKVKQKRRSR